MAIALTREQVRRVDRIAIDEYGIPGIVLMENAARSVADEAAQFIHDPTIQSIAIFCGGGNNGGDGYAVARHLHIHGYNVNVFAISDPGKLKGDAAINRAIVEKMAIPSFDVFETAQFDAAEPLWTKSSLIIDAILGTGFVGEMKPHVARVIAAINAFTSLPAGAKTIAVDVPSGLDCDSGIPAAHTIKADLTVTFVAPKTGFSNALARAVLGRVVVAGIGAPMEIVERAVRGGN